MVKKRMKVGFARKYAKRDMVKDAKWVKYHAKPNEKVVKTFKSGQFKGASIVKIKGKTYLRSKNKKNYILT